MKLLNSGVELLPCATAGAPEPAPPRPPLVVIGNYFLDSLRVDFFRVQPAAHPRKATSGRAPRGRGESAIHLQEVLLPADGRLLLTPRRKSRVVGFRNVHGYDTCYPDDVGLQLALAQCAAQKALHVGGAADFGCTADAAGGGAGADGDGEGNHAWRYFVFPVGACRCLQRLRGLTEAVS